MTANRILYATFDHPLLKLAGIQGLLEAWQQAYPPSDETEFLFLDEIQYVSDWQTWLKLEVDFRKHRRIVVTGSAIPLSMEEPESGVGRWHTVKLPTLSFYEYLRIKGINRAKTLPLVQSLREIFVWEKTDFVRAADAARSLVPHFHEYLLRGGFPQTANIDSIPLAQRLLREDIVDKVLKRDMTAYFGVRRILELERTFLYLCLHDGGILDLAQLSKELKLPKNTIQRFVDILEAAHLVYKLAPIGYGKEVLRGRHKVYLSDAAIAGSVLLKGKSLLEDSTRLGAAVETAFFKHLYARYYQLSVGFSYWRGRRDIEVDMIAEIQGELVPFEVKYSQSRVNRSHIKGLMAFCRERQIPRAYLIVRELDHFGVERFTEETELLRLPASLACLWISQSEAAENLP